MRDLGSLTAGRLLHRAGGHRGQSLVQPVGPIQVHRSGMVADGLDRGPQPILGEVVGAVVEGHVPVSDQPSIAEMSAAKVIGSNGFGMTPARRSGRHDPWSSAGTFAVRKMIGMSRVAGSARNAFAVAGPSRPGIITSSRIASGRSARARCWA